MSTLRLNLLMNLNHFEATTIMDVAIQLNVPIIQFHPDTLTSSLVKVDSTEWIKSITTVQKSINF